MKCRSCGEKWTTECGLAPGGFASPRTYLLWAIGLFFLGAVMGLSAVPKEIRALAAVGLVLCIFGVLVFLKCLLYCGYHDCATAYQGSVCPKCGKRNWIWPWSS